MNKKLIGLTCLAMLAVSMGSTISASASIIDNGNGTQTVDNANGSSDTTADITVNGQIGFDNTDGSNPTNPSDPNLWLNIEVPTDMAFYSTDSSDHKDIDGDAGTLKNNSGRPVSISVSDFTDGNGNAAQLDGISELDLIPTSGNTIDLKTFVGGELTTLISPDASGQDASVTGVSETTMKITGKVDSALKGQKQSTNELELNFTPLDKDGVTPLV